MINSTVYNGVELLTNDDNGAAKSDTCTACCEAAEGGCVCDKVDEFFQVKAEGVPR